MLYLQDVNYLDHRKLEFRSGHLSVEPGPTGTVAFVDAIPANVERHDCKGRIVTRAFANGHHHVYSALARGMPAPARSPRTFVEILELIWWNLDKALDGEMIRASAMAAAVDAARSGCTFVIDHHASPSCASGSLHLIAEAFDEVGVGHLLCYELSDRDGPDRRDAGLAESAAYLQHRPGLVGLHASFTVSEALLERAVQLASDCGTGIHMHVAEALSDEEHARATFGTSVVERLGRTGALDLPQTILAHCLHLDDTERELVRQSQAWVAHNNESNQNNAVGRFDPRGLGDRIFFGTDGMHCDLLASARAAYLDAQSGSGMTPSDAHSRLRRIHDYLATNGVAGDTDNNLIVLDYPSPTPVTGDNWPGHLMYGLTARHVHTVICQGRILVESSNVTTVDTDRVLAHAREQAARLWSRL